MGSWRYRLGARWYDALSLERWLYRRARLRTVELVAPRTGDRVLDLGCGTGLSLPAILAAVGPRGSVVGLDASAAMLAGARRRVGGDDRVTLVHADATELARHVDGAFDAAVCCYALSIVPSWRAVWREVVDRVRPGGRIGVVDTALPVGTARLLAPLAALFLLAGGVHPSRQVWRAVDELGDPRHEVSLAGHVRLGVGTVAR